MSAPSPAAASPPIAPPANPWRRVRVMKVVVNSGVGESGEPLQKARKVLEMITHQKPVGTRSRTTNRDFGIREGQEIGAKVTLRGPAAREFLGRAFDARDRQLDPESIDRNGNVSFGIPDYTDFPGMKYDPAIGIHGFDISVELGRAGARIRDRRVRRRALPRPMRVARDEARTFLAAEFKLTWLE
jgi:large subunit ribosomal protein L5